MPQMPVEGRVLLGSRVLVYALFGCKPLVPPPGCGGVIFRTEPPGGKTERRTLEDPPKAKRIFLHILALHFIPTVLYIHLFNYI